MRQTLQVNDLSIEKLVEVLKKDLVNWDTKYLERLGDFIEFELQDRLNRQLQNEDHTWRDVEDHWECD